MLIMIGDDEGCIDIGLVDGVLVVVGCCVNGFCDGFSDGCCVDVD